MKIVAYREIRRIVVIRSRENFKRLLQSVIFVPYNESAVFFWQLGAKEKYVYVCIVKRILSRTKVH